MQLALNPIIYVHMNWIAKQHTEIMDGIVFIHSIRKPTE